VTENPRPVHKPSNPGLAIGLILLSALAMTSGQLFWKLSASHPGFVLVGFAFYGFGAVSMIASFRFGEVSILHPMLSTSYVLCLAFGYFILKEPITPSKIAGIALISLGVASLAMSHHRSKIRT